MDTVSQKNANGVSQPTIDDLSKESSLICVHCGLECRDDSISIGDNLFCCHGCKKVYELLNANEMCAYYNLSDQPGITPKVDANGLKYGYLDDPDIQKQLLEFSDDKISKITFNIPSMHCASCIWLLEQLSSFNHAVTRSRVDFLKKSLTVTFQKNDITLRQLVELISSLGYEPDIRLEDIDKEKRSDFRKRLYLQIGIAGFAFGNIMLLSFPEYLARSGDTVNPSLRQLFTWINLVLALPVVFYSGWDYLSGAWKGLANKIVNLDVPIALGIIALFGRSIYEISFGVGAGYFDSLAGLVFLLLLGKLFQARTYETLSFERDYTSYFPIAVIRKDDDGEKSIPVVSLKQGDRIIVRNRELIPADSILIEGKGGIDYSFVTGESEPVSKESGDVVYAGGRQIGETIELEVIEEVSRSYLTRLWNDDSFKENSNKSYTNLANRISKYFVGGVLIIAFGAFFWHLPTSISLSFQVLISTLIVACPCALALATPFTLGTATRIMGQHNFYLKNAGVVEELSHINHVVFDKTGTLTNAGDLEVSWYGDPLTSEETSLLKSLLRHSTHPLSLKIFTSLPQTETLQVIEFNEIEGFGVTGVINDQLLRVGSSEFILSSDENFADGKNSDLDGVYIEIKGKVKGKFIFSSTIRSGVIDLINKLKNSLRLSLLSGDSDRDKSLFEEAFPKESKMLFRQKPIDKLRFINEQRENNHKVLMIGDGLNDAGALKASDVGIALTGDVTSFSPACDALLDSEALTKLDRFISFSKASMRIIVAGFILSILYNVVGLGFAVTGKLTPLVSAILMPLSSITIVAFVSFTTRIQAHISGFRR
jgi:P-type Cu+ transporter